MATTTPTGTAAPEAIHARMRSVNPAVIPRNHRVEEALSSAQEQADLAALQRLLAVLNEPYKERDDLGPYQEPSPCGAGYQTFCGT